ncbi:MAG: ribonuclease R [Tenericutes bacterium]|nr:ribonuclease R [Mycoplasmatota bacterium]
MKDKILNILETNDKAFTIYELKDVLCINTTDELESLIKTLNELENDLTIYHTNKDKYMGFKYSHLKKGKISITEKGYGFVLLKEEPDIFISSKNLNGASDGDMVIAEIISKNSGAKKEGRILRVASKSYDTIVGEFKTENDLFTIIPTDKKIKSKIVVTNDSAKDAVDGHIVVANYIKNINKNTLLCEITHIIGHKNDVGVDIEALIYKNNFSPSFSEEVLEEVKSIPNEVSEEEKANRRDLRDVTIFTIDGDDTKDIDDAISIKKLANGNYELGVHIADVSYYVKPGTKLYEEAYERGTSVYLVDRVVPMLPHKLSNGICSLNPNVDRLAQSCIMEIDSKGNVVSHEIFESVIRSRIQMTYKKVNNWLENHVVEEGYEPYTDDLTMMMELSKIIRDNRSARGAIDFDTKEAKILADENGKPTDVILRNRGVGEKMIEDFMIAANETVASHVFWMGLPFVYRVHGTPKEEKINDFLDFVSSLGYKITGKVNIKYPSSIENILRQLRDKKEYEVLSTLMLRAMQKAVYQPENIGHFGLASKIYTHFTSPIRRFPDTTVHRLLRTYIYENDQSQKTIDYYKEYLPLLTEHCSLKERDAITCEREVEDMKMAEYMMDHIGEEYKGMISGVTSFGMFIQLPNMIEGLVHINDIPGDYYNYNEKTMSLIGQKTKKKYQIGNEVTVIVKSASKEDSYIDFEIKEEKTDENEEKKEA